MLLAVAAVVATIVTLIAVNASGDSSDAWQSALRADVARGVAAVQDIRYVYEVEAPAAFGVAGSEVQAEEYRRAASSAPPMVRAGLELRAQALDLALDTVRGGAEMAVPAYALPAGAYDTRRRLADRIGARGADPTYVARDPDGLMALGDAAAARSVRLMDSLVVIAFAFLFGALAEAFARWRQTLLRFGWLALGAGSVAAVTSGLLG